ncbi:MAG: trigger factor [Candidatus Aminicenantes bacterium]|nr:trigger factor [Candidatus Aminicenantes bacterium]
METPKSTLNKISECKRELEIVVPKEKVVLEFETAIREFSKQAKVKGFRRGMAPTDVVKRIYLDDIKESLINSLAPKAINQELREKELVPVDSPVITELDFEENQPLKLKAEFEVWPEFKLPQYKSIKVKKQKGSVTAKDVESSLEDLREKSAQYEPVSGRGVVENDYVMAKVQGKDIHTKRLLPSEKVFILTGHPDNEKALNDSLLGMQEGEEKNFKVKYPKEHQNKKVAGKEIDYHIKVVSLKEKKLPDIDDDFAKDLGQFETIKELKEEIKKQLKATRDQVSKREIREDIVSQIAGSLTLELPDTIVEKETLMNLRQILQSRPQQATNKEEFEKLQSEAKLSAERTIKNHLILTKIAQEEKLEVTDEDLNDEFKRIAETNNMPLPRVAEAMNREGKKDELRQNLQLKKTLDFLVKNAIIE